MTEPEHRVKPRRKVFAVAAAIFAGLLSDKDMLNVARYVASFKPKKK